MSRVSEDMIGRLFLLLGLFGNIASRIHSGRATRLRQVSGKGMAWVPCGRSGTTTTGT